jgi:uncharacterized protein YdiU (UPF0061 family)
VTLPFDNTYARLPERFYARVRPTPVQKPELLAVNEELAATLGVSEALLRDPAVWAGNAIPEGAEPIALAYAGHQFGGLVPQLGDGRAILLGELVGTDGKRRDVQLKGSGRTPFSRGGDGRAAVGPVLRELVVSEAMHALGVPTTRALAAVRTGEPVYRETVLPGAVLTRVASSHLRVGTFQYFAIRDDREALVLLTKYALARHYPDEKREASEALTLLERVMDAQARLVARWLSLGFIHGVMNTDNTSISGETIDYGPCAFMDAFDPVRHFSSIDQHGRYAFARQPGIAMWNLARMAEALLPLIDDDEARAIAVATERIESFPARFEPLYAAELRKKLGLARAEDDDFDLAKALLGLMAQSHADYTLTFRRLAEVVSGDPSTLAASFREPVAFLSWVEGWRARLSREAADPSEQAARIRSASPAFIPRNHRVEEVIAAAAAGDLKPLERLRRVLSRPYDDQPDASELALPPGDEQWSYATFCGT